MSEHHRGAWSAREDAMWWPGGISADQQQNIHQQQQQILQQQLQQQQQQQNHQDVANSSAAAAVSQQLFSYKMASSFQNPATTVTFSNVSPTSPVGAQGARGYDYRLGGSMAGGSPTMSAPAQAAQWWYPPSTMDNMHTTLQTLTNMQHQNMTPVQTPPPSTQTDGQQQQQQQQARQEEAQRQHQEAAQRRQEEAHRQHQEAHRQHQEAQRQQVEAQQAAIQQHHQALADQVRHQQQLQQQAQQQQQRVQQLQHQVQQNNHHQHNQVLQQQQQVTGAGGGAVTNKGRMPRGKGDARPRGRMTAYAFFVQTCREEHKKKHPEENVVFAEFSKKCAERWKTMVDKEKKRFHEMAENDKKRYDAEMQNYTPPKGEKQRGKKRKQMKDPNAPKRSLSAFFWFSNDERSKVKGQNPEYGVGDVAKELGRRWADADHELKSKYEAMADRDKARYEKEMTAYKKKNNPALQQVVAPPPVPVPDDVEDDDDEVEDDDDE